MSEGNDWEAARAALIAKSQRLEEAEFQRAKRLQRARTEQEAKEQVEHAALGLPPLSAEEIRVDPYQQGAFLWSTSRVGEPGNPKIDTLGALYITVLSEQNARDVERDFTELSTVKQDHARYEGRRHIELAGDFRTLPLVERAEEVVDGGQEVGHFDGQ